MFKKIVLIITALGVAGVASAFTAQVKPDYSGNTPLNYTITCSSGTVTPSGSSPLTNANSKSISGSLSDIKNCQITFSNSQKDQKNVSGLPSQTDGTVGKALDDCKSGKKLVITVTYPSPNNFNVTVLKQKMKIDTACYN